MDSIQSKIEALTQELRPYPERVKMKTARPLTMTESLFWYFEGRDVSICNFFGTDDDKLKWSHSLFASTNKAEVEEYADCYKRLKLYQLIGEKAEKEFPLDWDNSDVILMKATDFFTNRSSIDGNVSHTNRFGIRPCVLGGVWFAREEDRLEALKICGIDKAFQEKCSKYGLGGA